MSGVIHIHIDKIASAWVRGNVVLVILRHALLLIIHEIKLTFTTLISTQRVHTVSLFQVFKLLLLEKFQTFL